MLRCALKMAAERPFWMRSKKKIDGHQLHTKGQYHAKYQENRSSHLRDLGGDGRTDARQHARTDRRHPFLYPPERVASGDNKGILLTRDLFKAENY